MAFDLLPETCRQFPEHIAVNLKVGELCRWPVAPVLRRDSRQAADELRVCAHSPRLEASSEVLPQEGGEVSAARPAVVARHHPTAVDGLHFVDARVPVVHVRDGRRPGGVAKVAPKEPLVVVQARALPSRLLPAQVEGPRPVPRGGVAVPHELHEVLEGAAAGFEEVPTALEGAHPAADEGGVRELVEVSVHHVPDLSGWHAVGDHDCDGAWVHQGKAAAGEATQLSVRHNVE